MGQRLPAPKRYIVYRETSQGRADSGVDIRRKARAGGSSHWEIAICGKPSLNSYKMHGPNSKRTIPTARAEVHFTKDPETGLKSMDI